MTQLSGSIAIEVDLDRVTDEIANRVLTRLREAYRETGAHDHAHAAGSDDYDRGEAPPSTITDADPGGYPLGGRRHPTTPEGDPS